MNDAISLLLIRQQRCRKTSILGWSQTITIGVQTALVHSPASENDDATFPVARNTPPDSTRFSAPHRLRTGTLAEKPTAP